MLFKLGNFRSSDHEHARIDAKDTYGDERLHCVIGITAQSELYRECGRTPLK